MITAIFSIYGNAQYSRTNQLFRPCASSTTPASVRITKAGGITLTPCSGQSVANTSAFGFTQGTLTASTPFISHTATWNSAGTTFTNLLSNVTNTASGASSLLMDLQVGGVSQFSVGKAGTVVATGNVTSGNYFITPTGAGLLVTSAGYFEGFGDGTFRAKNISAATTTAILGGSAAVASAAALPVPVGGLYHITGTTNVTSITSTNLASGVCIVLIFDGVLTFTDGSNLKLAGNFVTTADDTITLCYDGTNWYETARAVN